MSKMCRPIEIDLVLMLSTYKRLFIASWVSTGTMPNCNIDPKKPTPVVL